MKDATRFASRSASWVSRKQACRYTARQPFCLRFAGRAIVPRRARQHPALGNRVSKATISRVVSAAKVGAAIFVTRSKASGRKIANEEEILPILAGRGFVRSRLEEMSLDAQIRLFSEAEAVVAPHGAGLTHLIWCAPHTKVLEIFSPRYVNLCYWAIASVTQADYYYLLGNGEEVVNDVNDARYFLEDIWWIQALSSRRWML